LIYGLKGVPDYKNMQHLIYRVLFCFTLCIKNDDMDEQKLKFITETCVTLFKTLKGNEPGNWGKMNAQQMVEHLTTIFYVSSGKIKFDLVTPPEHLPKYKEFLLSDKEFRENTKAPVNIIGEDALPLQYATMEDALENLAASIASFENYFKEDTGHKTMHPVFGGLNFEEWVLLHYKHVTHHLRQFGLM
jgi:oxepin-CoA hydrolase/3-oxo-5,6-dehydrosuberyl-CoA semialdehyde dehydrogenase